MLKVYPSIMLILMTQFKLRWNKEAKIDQLPLPR